MENKHKWLRGHSVIDRDKLRDKDKFILARVIKVDGHIYTLKYDDLVEYAKKFDSKWLFNPNGDSNGR